MIIIRTLGSARSLSLKAEITAIVSDYLSKINKTESEIEVVIGVSARKVLYIHFPGDNLTFEQKQEIKAVLKHLN